MKKTKLFYLFLVLATIFTTSCDEDEIINALTLSNNEVALLPGANAKVTVKTGNQGYVAVSANEAIATAMVKDKVITITAVKAGSTMVNVSDDKGKKAVIKVTVKSMLALEKSEVTVLPGKTDMVAITAGSGKYEVTTSDAKVATATIDGNKVKVAGVAKGMATITVTDKDTKVKKELKVTVKPLLDIENADVAVIEGETATVTIKDGTGKYTVTSSDEKVAKASVADNTVTIQGVAAGNATITLTDTDTKTAKEIKVVVKPMLALEKAEVTVKEGEEVAVAIQKGSGKYEAVSSDDKIATVKIEGETVKVTGVAKGMATITVKDTDTNKEQTLKVTVKAVLKLAKTELAINQGETERVAVVNVVNDSYEIVAEPADVLKVEKGGTDYEGKYVDALVITPLKYSKDAVKVTVKSGDQEAVLMVTVNPVATIKLSKTETALEVEAKEEIRIIKGNGGYTVAVENADFVKAEVKLVEKPNQTPEYVVALEGKAEGTTNVKVTDVAGKEATIKVTVTAKPDPNAIFNIDADGLVYKKEGAVVKGDIVIPENGKIIAAYGYSGKVTPFGNNKEVTSIDFANVEEIRQMAIYSNTALTKVHLRKVKNFGMGVFYLCGALKEVYAYMEDPSAITFGSYVFNGTPGDKVLYVPKGKVDAYKASGFKDYFTTIKEMEGDNPVQDADVEIDEDGLVYEKAGVELEGDLRVPDAGTTIARYTGDQKNSPFAYKANITSIDFNNVTNLKGAQCVAKCKDLTTVHLRKVTDIGQGAFYYCTKLKAVYCYTDAAPYIGFSAKKDAFKGIDANAILYVPKGKKDVYAGSRLAPFFSEIKEME